jgi:hypothetical protein
MSRAERERGGGGVGLRMRSKLENLLFPSCEKRMRALPKPLWPIETAPIILVHTVD